MGFLVEEAYNQERGEVQHTLNAIYTSDFRRRGWSFNVEQRRCGIRVEYRRQ
jgi:hypothetical protein